MKRMTYIGLGFGFVLGAMLLASPAGAQTTSQDQGQSSLGDYARKVRKDPGAAKAKPKVFDNDNLPTDDKLSVIGQPPVANAATAQAEADKAAEPKTPAEDDQAKKQALWK